MAEKKYLDLTGLTSYDAKLKTLIDQKDAATLQSAKTYSDGLADNYDPAGSAATALTDAKAYADAEVAKANAAAAAAQTQADKGVADAAAAKSAADAAQADVDALETYVGTIPEGATSTNVVAYVQEKTSGIATDAALTELQAAVTSAQKDIDAVEADYLKAADKTELQSNIDAVGAKVTTLVGSDTGKSVRTIANEELAAQLIPETAADSLDTLQEIAAWIQAHPDDASAMNAAITALDTYVGDIPETATAKDIVAYIQEVVNTEKTRAEAAESGLDTRLDAVEAQLGTGTGSVAEQIATAKSEAIASATATAAADATSKADAALTSAKSYTDAEIDKVEETVATTNSNVTALGERVTTAEGKITTLEGASHTHANKTVLDGIDASKVAAWDGAVTDSHTHTNKTVLDGITSAKVSAWDAAETNAKAYADEKVAEFMAISSTEIDGLFATA